MSKDWILGCAAACLLAGLALFAISAWRSLGRRRRESRVIDRALAGPMMAVRGEGVAKEEGNWRQRLLEAIQALGERFGKGRLGQALLTAEDRLLLGQINRNTPQGRAIFLGLRLALAVATPLPALLWFRPGGFNVIVVCIGAAAFGLIAPKLLLDAMAKRLRKRAEDELPLLVDLMRLLQGVGFSVDQSLQVVSDRFQAPLPLLSREIREANVAYAHGRNRMQSLRRLCEFGCDGLQGFVQILVQVHEHGGAVQEPLRQFVDRLREQRKLRMKEQSGKLSVKMTIVMMLTLLPALMLVLAGPAVISLIGTMTKLKVH
ncbi:type II secretion system F family protein [Dyella amyloliquefaciens]|uniref:type II secretion system F family protein n=1 Tax=Dyella amyloliquefaciens TaxID=1770545 RepID=UPI001E3BF84D|nr:type II secretion system F family protein [Dyella amyloliquefaciens]